MAEQKDAISETLMPAPTTQISPFVPAAPGGHDVSLPVSSPPAVVTVPEPLPAILERVDWLLVGLLLVLAFLLGSFAATNSDVWLQLASGRRIAEGRWTIGVDPFSFATEATTGRPAVPWVEHSWLYSLAFYWLYNLVGGAGLVVLKALAVVALAWCLLQIPGGKANRFVSFIYVSLALLALSPHLLLRPVTVSFLFFAITLLTCYRAGALGSAPVNPRVLWRLPLLFLLWANLDAWFIMGPLAIALLWAGRGLGRLLGLPAAFPGKTLGAVLVVGLLACLVNPHHVRVFMLPPELASLIAPFAESPDFLLAGGRALHNLHLVEPDYYPLVSPLSPRYWQNLNIAAACCYPLLVLGAISFVVNALASRKPGAAALHPGRFVLWIVLAFLGLLQARLLPWFVIATAPLTLLNLADWRAGVSKVPVPDWRAAQLGRSVALVVVLLALFLAWPGWLSASWGDWMAPRRVAWTMPVDPSYQAAALRLAALHEDGKDLHVFNFDPDIASYCAWYAPEVKCYVDLRWSLFADETARYARARQAMSFGNMPEIWQKAFAAHKIDFLVLGKFPTRRESELTGRLWLDEAHWRQKYGDGRTVIFAWLGANPGPRGEFQAELNRRAFGAVPEDERAPARLPAPPQEEVSLWSQYAEGPEPLPLAASEALLWLSYHEFMGSQAWGGPYIMASLVARWAEPAGLGSLTVTIPYARITMENIPGRMYVKRLNGQPFLRSRDFGPPAAPLLMIRAARRAVAASPGDPRVYRILSDALKDLLNRQEDYWANYTRDPRANGTRHAMRQIQIMTALTTYLDMHPDDPEINELVADMFKQMQFLDVALDHLEQAGQNFDQYRRVTGNAEALKQKRSELDKKIKELKEEVKKRRDDYGLEAASKRALDKYPLARKYGLGKEGAELLRNIKVEELRPEEQKARAVWFVELLLLLGRANSLQPDNIPGDLPELRMVHAAATGNYVVLDEALADIEKKQSESTLNRARACASAVLAHGVNQGLAVQLAALPRAGLMAFAQLQLAQTLEALTPLAALRAEAETRTLRGVIALELGDTAAARRHLEGALRGAGPGTAFQDRVLAERYLDLLRAAQP